MQPVHSHPPINDHGNVIAPIARVSGGGATGFVPKHSNDNTLDPRIAANVEHFWRELFTPTARSK